MTVTIKIEDATWSPDLKTLTIEASQLGQVEDGMPRIIAIEGRDRVETFEFARAIRTLDSEDEVVYWRYRPQSPVSPVDSLVVLND